MNANSSVTVTWGGMLATAKSFLREAASVAGLVLSVGNQLHLPPAVRTAMFAVSGWIQVVEHQVYKVKAGTSSSSSSSSSTGA